MVPTNLNNNSCALPALDLHVITSFILENATSFVEFGSRLTNEQNSRFE